MLVQAEGPALSPAAVPKEMLSTSVLADGRTKVRINFSSLSIMQECWRKTEYSLVRGLRSNLESPATLFGSAIHKGLEEFYLSPKQDRELPLDIHEKMKAIGCEIWEPEWANYAVLRAGAAFVDKAQPLKALSADNKRSISNGTYLLGHYFEKYYQDPYTVYCDDAGPFVERKFSMPIYEDSTIIIEAFGQIDIVLQNEQTGQRLPGDHKTTSQLGTQFYQRLNPNHQYTFYSWAANSVFGLNTDSFMVNALQVKEPPKTARGSAPQFARQVTTRTQSDYEELRAAIIDSTQAFLRHSAAGYFPMTAPGPCSNYGGCTYLDACAAPVSLRETVLSAKYSGVTHG